MINRSFDIILSFFILIVTFFPVIIILIIVTIDLKANPIYFSKRFGKERKMFYMPKIRTMKVNTPEIATHMLKDKHNYITKFGSFLRINSIDEIPQLYSVIKGDMSFFGPRPALFNQNDLIILRDRYKINSVKPGITGLAQVKFRDQISLKNKVLVEKIYLNNFNFCFNCKLLIITIIAVFLKKKYFPLMIIDHNKKFIFFKCGKVSGTTFELCIRKLYKKNINTLGFGDIRKILPVENINSLKSRFKFLSSIIIHNIKQFLKFIFPKRLIKYYNPPIFISSFRLKDHLFQEHMGPTELLNLIDKNIFNDYFKFCIVRNPFDQAISHYNHLRISKKINLSFDLFLEKYYEEFALKEISMVENNGIYVLNGFIRYENFEKDLDIIVKKLNLDNQIINLYKKTYANLPEKKKKATINLNTNQINYIKMKANKLFNYFYPELL